MVQEAAVGHHHLQEAAVGHHHLQEAAVGHQFADNTGDSLLSTSCFLISRYLNEIWLSEDNTDEILYSIDFDSSCPEYFIYIKKTMSKIYKCRYLIGGNDFEWE